MGAGRTTAGRPTQKPHRHHRAAAPPSQPPQPGKPKAKTKLVLRSRLPKAGLVYPFDRTLLRRYRRDLALSTALRKDTQLVSPKLLDARFSRMFELATELLSQQQQSGSVETEARRGSDGTGPIAFIASLRQHDALAPWAPAVSEDLFISLFLVLGAARRNWYDAPQKPLDVARHCALARAIDAFGRAEQFEWSGVDVIAWVRGGGLMFHNGKIARVGGVDDEMEEDSGGDQESDSDDGRFAGSMSSLVGKNMEDEMEDGVDGLFAGQMRSMTVEDTSKGREDKGDAAAREREDARRKLDLTLDQVVESMRLLNIAFDEAALAESFAALRIHDGESPGRRQKGHQRFF